MTDTANNNPVSDIWSAGTSGQSVAQPQNPASDNPNNPSPYTKTFSGSEGAKPGLAGGEGGSKWEVDPVSEELLARARREQAEQMAEIFKSPEKVRTPEIAKVPEPAGSSSETREEKEVVIKTAGDIPTAKGKIVDKRTGHERTHRVSDSATPETKKADLDEQEFIEKVEQIHTQT